MSRESEDGGALTDPATEPCNLEGVEGSLGSSVFLRRGKRRAEAPKDVFCILVLLQKCSIVLVGEGFATVGEGFAAVGEGFATVGKGFAAVGEGFATVGEGLTTVGEGFATVGEGFGMDGVVQNLIAVRIHEQYLVGPSFRPMCTR
jgi:hypothetical protein